MGCREEPVRSALFVPANRRAWIEKAPVHGADVLVLDLEDATPAGEKDSARETVHEVLPLLSEKGQAAWVRVNALDSGLIEADLAAACHPGVSVICLPKVAAPEQVAEVDRLIAYAEGANQLPLGTIGIYPLLETAEGLLRADAVFGGSPRVRYAGALAAHGADIEFAVGFRWTGTFDESRAYRSMALLAARANGVENPITGLVTTLDEDETRRFAEESRSLGYAGMFVIHPSQVPVANTAFAPTDDERQWSEEVLRAYAAASADGRGTLLDSRGRLIDFAMLRTAERVAERCRHFARERADA